MSCPSSPWPVREHRSQFARGLEGIVHQCQRLHQRRNYPYTQAILQCTVPPRGFAPTCPGGNPHGNELLGCCAIRITLVWVNARGCDDGYHGCVLVLVRASLGLFLWFVDLRQGCPSGVPVWAGQQVMQPHTLMSAPAAIHVLCPGHCGTQRHRILAEVLH